MVSLCKDDPYFVKLVEWMIDLLVPEVH